MEPMTDRMKLRIQSFVALKSALLPAFCEDMPCDERCPLYINTRIRNDFCEWMKACESIDKMELKLLKENR